MTIKENMEQFENKLAEGKEEYLAMPRISEDCYDIFEMGKGLCTLISDTDYWLVSELEEAFYQLRLKAEDPCNDRCFRVLWNVMQKVTDLAQDDLKNKPW